MDLKLLWDGVVILVGLERGKCASSPGLAVEYLEDSRGAFPVGLDL